MATELEFKLAVPNPALLEQILFDETVGQLRKTDYRLIEMAAVYYDTPDRRLRDRKWTLRLRQENDRLIAALKTPGQGRARGEWQCEASHIRQAIGKLMTEGAPEELGTLTADAVLQPVCAARYTRRAADLMFGDGTVCELCGDVGLLTGGGREEPLCEVEVELKSGESCMAEAFAEELMDRFSLREETRSKFARALALAKG